MAKTRALYYIDEDGKNCPICGFPLGQSSLGVFCQNPEKINCFYVDGMAALTVAQAKKLKDKIKKVKNINFNTTINYGKKTKKS